jgi:hypothetical protein
MTVIWAIRGCRSDIWTVNEPFVLRECESVRLSERHKLRVFENGLLGKVFRIKRDEVTG